VYEAYGPGGARPREDEGSGVLDVLGNGIEPKFCFHPLPNTVSQQYRNRIKDRSHKGGGGGWGAMEEPVEGDDLRGARQDPAE
jgi:hypothetical protein